MDQPVELGAVGRSQFLARIQLVRGPPTGLHGSGEPDLVLGGEEQVGGNLFEVDPNGVGDRHRLPPVLWHPPATFPEGTRRSTPRYPPAPFAVLFYPLTRHNVTRKMLGCNRWSLSEAKKQSRSGRRYPVGPMRLARRTLPMAPLLVCLVLLPACVAGPVAVLGETGPPPPGLAGPLPQVQVLVVDDEGNPVADAAVRFDGTAPVVTGSDGLAAWTGPGGPIEVNARGPGLRPASAQIESLIEEPLEVILQPVVLNGRVVTEAGKPITGVEVTLGEQSTVTDDAGRSPCDGRRRGAHRMDAGLGAGAGSWDGRSQRVTVEMSPLMVRGLHVAGWLPANEEVWPGLLDLVERTELNALVVDIKDESGSVFHDSEVEVATVPVRSSRNTTSRSSPPSLHERDSLSRRADRRLPGPDRSARHPGNGDP